MDCGSQFLKLVTRANMKRLVVGSLTDGFDAGLKHLNRACDPSCDIPAHQPQEAQHDKADHCKVSELVLNRRITFHRLLPNKHMPRIFRQSELEHRRIPDDGVCPAMAVIVCNPPPRFSRDDRRHQSTRNAMRLPWQNRTDQRISSIIE